MNKILLVGLLLSGIGAQAQSGAFTVKGQLGRQTPPTKAYLVYPVADKIKKDSADVKNGRFTFTGSVTEPTLASLFVLRPGTNSRNGSRYSTNRRFYRLYLEPGTVRVSSPDSMHHATLAGTPLNADQNRLLVLMRPTTGRWSALSRDEDAASAAQPRDPALEAAHAQRAAALYAEERMLRKQFIQRHPQSRVSLDVLQQYSGPSLDPAEVGPLFENLALAVRQSTTGQRYAARLAKARQLMVGALAPDFTQNDPNGRPVKLSDFRGQYVLLDFWASWCKPCREENPNVVANYNQYKNHRFTVLGVSLDRPTGREAWLKAIDADHLTWTHVSDLKFWQNEVAQRYDVQSVPQNLLIDPEGRIVAKNIRGENLGQTLARVLPGAKP
jgi:peroxiredoxin